MITPNSEEKNEAELVSWRGGGAFVEPDLLWVNLSSLSEIVSQHPSTSDLSVNEPWMNV